ncbi:NAD(P)H-hydrate epimerase [Limosilactobacillus vaginalis]|jgi:NAD(P)H-hydrate epimerase|uniref:NAD(P)H-hydrate epimerase n=3 Tax=Limosilactobacillus TaxID=2742598 RepID=A0AAP3M2G1_9LACO|nr:MULTISPECIES: NAD(P)H-hydrate epimerase [Limosilactobacillus]PMC28430.1 NAD(P)H-hydrate epimerase [Gardnerella vaginalis]EEJ40434.1 YjeF-like protein [Limosilactobacillus vaginalis DSM 5837 = ATCC 49540]KRM48257.1 sugar kinase [Limosilactobacillus vaginalis DSM 5837 = ATCC 49540]MBU9694421.1 NAD(P)H-hydrate epimerase [Limosilactobacillus portuensis]MCZ2466437.1 NAD(P)H-hydrate epimerase [Limosilactobacillus vaginalis]
MADKAITAEQMRHYDSYTINTIGIPSLVLMERAALAVRDEVLNAFPLNLQNIVVVAGSGNNGGDGLDVARLLHIAGVKVTILNVGNPDHASNEHQVQDRICQYYKIPQTSDLNVLKDASLIVDALFGIGIDRPVEGNYATAIEAINNSDAVVVAVDMPSGINTDTGEVMGVAVNATATVTFAVNKVGLTKSAGKKHAGRVVVASDMGTYPVDD